jgi:hypothetical protein
MRSLVDAALRDQERRILAATPAEITGRIWSECRNCEGRLRTNNKSGFCSKPPCVKIAQQERRAKKG